MNIAFQPWAKTSRHFRDVVITEKIDGTNAAIGIVQIDDLDAFLDDNRTKYTAVVQTAETAYAIYTQSRTRLITPGKSTDNYGFAGWVAEHAEELFIYLGEGLHFGEWWGAGIQRGYGLTKNDKRFSLFNTGAHEGIYERSNGLLRTVPVLYQGLNDTARVEEALTLLKENGSEAAPGFDNPEGVCIYHTASRTVSKVTLDNNDSGKWVTA